MQSPCNLEQRRGSNRLTLLRGGCALCLLCLPFLTAWSADRGVPSLRQTDHVTSLLWHAHDAGVPHALYAFDTPLQRHRFHAWIHGLRCLVCQSQSVADSDATFAVDLRAGIYRWIRAGKTDAQIRHFLLQRYGTFIFLSPSLRTQTWLLWGGPILLLGAVVGVGVYHYRRAYPVC